jgi:TonB family protein
MPMKSDFLLYLLQASGCMAVLYLLYRLLLHRETFFSFNRWYILGGLGLSLLLPLIELPDSPTPLYVMPAIQLDPIVAVGGNAEKSFDWKGLLVELYEVGVFIFAARLLYRLYHIRNLARQLPGENRRNYVLLRTGGSLPTFSFLKWLFWDETSQLTDYEQNQMLRHEEAHIRQRHSIDVLLLEIAGVIFWFNPFIYLFGREIKAVHEYLADRAALQESDASAYLKLIAMQALRISNQALIQPFHSHPIKNRIRMIYSAQKAKPAIWKTAACIAILCVFSVLYACRTQEVIEPGQNAAQVDQMPVISEQFAREVQKTIRYPKSAREDAVKGSVYANFLVDKEGKISDIKIVKSVRDDLDNEAIRALSEASARWQPGLQGEKPVDVRVTFPITFYMDTENGEKIPAQREGIVVVGYGAKGYGQQVEPNPVIPDEEDVYTVVEQMPEYVGGMPELGNFLSQNIKYPAEAREKKITGTVFVGFVVQADGSIQMAKVLKGPGSGMDEEALRVVRAMPKWTPGMQSGKAVAVKYTLPIKFALN